MLGRLAELAARSAQLRERAFEKEAFMGLGLKRPTLTGAVIGAGANVLRGALKPPEVDPVTGQQKGRMSGALGNAATGALFGGAAGKLVGQAAKPGNWAAFKAAPKEVGKKALSATAGTMGAAYGAYQTAHHLHGKYQQNKAGFDPAVQRMNMGEPQAPGMIS